MATPTKSKRTTTRTAKKTTRKMANDPLEIVAVPFTLHKLDRGEEIPVDKGLKTLKIKPPRWFAVSLKKPLAKRFVHVIQLNEIGVVMLHLGDRETLISESGLRLPRDGTWLRALVNGTVHVYGADVPLLPSDIRSFVRGGHEPAPGQAKPPYT